jgi:hypothetical protein
VRALKHPATVIASVALFAALGGGAAAYAAGMINGSQIKNHTISAKKLTNSAVKSLHGVSPKLVTFDGTGTSSTPTATPLGTFLGVTLSAACATTSGDAEIILNLNTSDGSWKTDVGELYSSGSSTGYINLPAGSLSTPMPLTLTAASGGSTNSTYIDFVQEGPSAGEMVWNLTVSTSTPSPTCHFSLQYLPEAVTAHTAAPRASVRTTPASLRKLLGLGGLR